MPKKQNAKADLDAMTALFSLNAEQKQQLDALLQDPARLQALLMSAQAQQLTQRLKEQGRLD